MTDPQLLKRYKSFLHALCLHHLLLKEEVDTKLEYASNLPDGPRRDRLMAVARTWRDVRRGKLWMIKRFTPDLLHFFGTDIPEDVARLPLSESFDSNLDHMGLDALERIPATKLGVPKETQPQARNWRMSQLGM